MRARHAFSAATVLVSCIAATSPPVAQADGYFQVLYDTTEPASVEYRADMGYAVFVNYDGVRLLLDTGADPAILQNNLQAAGVEPAALDLVAISHSHFDHAGGLSYVREAAPKVPVHAPPGERLDGGALHYVEDHLRITSRLYLIRTHTDQPTSGIADELSLLIITARGPYLITACSHTGVPEILDRAERIAGQSVFFYTGGARLNFRPARDTLETARILKERGVAHVSPGHCSAGHEVAALFSQTYDTGYVASRLGERVALTTPH